MISIIVSFNFWFPLIFEVISIILLCMPFVIWIWNIKTPTHHLAVSNCWVSRWELYLQVVSLRIERILRWRSPLHQGTFESVLGWEIDNPIFAKHFILRVTMNVLLLRHVNSSNSVLELSPVSCGIRLNCSTSTAEIAYLSSLGKSNFIRVSKIR